MVFPLTVKDWLEPFEHKESNLLMICVHVQINLIALFLEILQAER